MTYVSPYDIAGIQQMIERAYDVDYLESRFKLKDLVKKIDNEVSLILEESETLEIPYSSILNWIKSVSKHFKNYGPDDHKRYQLIFMYEVLDLDNLENFKNSYESIELLNVNDLRNQMNDSMSLIYTCEQLIDTTFKDNGLFVKTEDNIKIHKNFVTDTLELIKEKLPSEFFYNKELDMSINTLALFGIHKFLSEISSSDS